MATGTGTIAAGTRHFGRVEGVLTTAIYVAQHVGPDDTAVYLLAIPADNATGPRVREARGPNQEKLLVRLVAVPKLDGRSFRLSPPKRGVRPIHWPEEVSPRLDDLAEIAKDPRALPIHEARREIMMSEVEDSAEPDTDSEHEGNVRAQLAELDD